MNQNAWLGIFPFAFLGLWLAITTIVGVFSGWRALTDRFPDSGETALYTLRFQSGALGKGSLMNPWGNVSYGNCLRFDVCKSGLRVKVWRIFGLFERPFQVPWDRIGVEERKILFLTYSRLSFGDPILSALTINRRAFQNIARSGL